MPGTEIMERIAGPGGGGSARPAERNPGQERLGAGLDLRRGFRREVAEAILAAAAHLPATDRFLLERVFRDGRPIAGVAREWGPHGQRFAASDGLQRQLTRRLRTLVSRIGTPEFAYVTRHLEQWSQMRQAVARACFLHGMSQREAADLLGLSLHTVRRHAQAIGSLCEAARRPTGAGGRAAARDGRQWKEVRR